MKKAYNSKLYIDSKLKAASQVAQLEKHLSANAGDIRDASLIPGLERSLEKEIVTHSSILAWEIPLTEEAVGLQPMGSPSWPHLST